jgi:hypothetical protein
VPGVLAAATNWLSAPVLRSFSVTAMDRFWVADSAPTRWE